MIPKEQIGITHYSKVLDRNITILEGYSEDYIKLVGLGHILVEPEKVKASFPKHEKGNDSDK